MPHRTHLFSPEGLAALAATLEQRPLLAFDFDGTLAPIVARPADARPSQAVTTRLASLTQMLPVAVLSGRALADLRPRLGFEPRWAIGNHGAEDDEDPAAAAVWRHALDPLRETLALRAPALQAAGVAIEDKAQSIALHYRLARRGDQARALIAALLAPFEPGLRVYAGKKVFNVVAAAAPDKARALMDLVRRCGAASALYAGDDSNDEPVFVAAPPQWLTLRVGREDPTTCARFFIDSPVETAMLLERVLQLLKQQGDQWA